MRKKVWHVVWQTMMVLGILHYGCSKKEKLYTQEELVKLASEKSFEVKVLPPSKKISCDSYGQGCLSIILVEVDHLSMIWVQYNSQTNAEIAAKMISAPFYHNWVFDDVTGEPVLEKFIERAFEVTSH